MATKRFCLFKHTRDSMGEFRLGLKRRNNLFIISSAPYSALVCINCYMKITPVERPKARISIDSYFNIWTAGVCGQGIGFCF